MSRLPLKSHLAYSIPAFPLALLGVTVYVYLPKYYAANAGADLVFLGLVVGAVRLWNAIVDPAIGILSDRMSIYSGARLKWLTYSAAPLAISTVLLFNPGLNPSWLRPELCFIIYSLLFFTLISSYSVPYEALGAELSNDCHERTRLSGYRSGAFLLGTLSAAVFPLVLNHLGLSPKSVWLTLSLGYGGFLLLATLLASTLLHPPPNRFSPPKSITHSLSELTHNKPFVLLLSALMLSSFAAAMPAALILFFVEDVLQSSNAHLFLVLYFLIGILTLPFWLWLAKRTTKQRAWLGAMLMNTAAFTGVFFVGPGDELLYALFVALSAFGLGGSLAIPPSLQADVIDLEATRTATAKSGQMMGLWSVGREASTALGTGLALLLLGLSGYDATATAHSAEQLESLQLLYSLVPCGINLVAIAIASRIVVELNTETNSQTRTSEQSDER